MSTKIYNGYLFNKSLSLVQLQDLLVDCRQSLNALALAEWHSLYTRAYLNILDAFSFNIHGELPAYQQLENAIDKSLAQIRKGCRDNFDLSVEIAIKEYQGKFYCGLFTENATLKKAVVAHLDLNEYFYWNNADKPDELTDQEWQERSVNWDHLLQNNTWIDSGFLSFKVVSEDIVHGWISYEDLDVNLLDHQRRSESWVKRRVIHELSEKRAAEHKDYPSLKPSEYMRIQHQVIDEISDGQHLEVFDQWRAFFAKMAPDITPENFQTLCRWN